MYKKIVSVITLTSLIFTSYFSVGITYAVDTNNSSAPWTIQKATHLARKALYGATPQKVQELYNAGSSASAVNILFPSINGPDRSTYDSQMSAIISDEGFNPSDAGDMYSYYIAKKFLDPYEAKSKLFLMYEDIFSVNRDNGRDITYTDIENTHNMLYSNSLGNYKEMIKQNLYNTDNSGDYSLGKFLDLFNQTNPARPNENYAREILQLFLMLEYIPTESEDNGDTRNYSEEDVAALAKILMGFESNENTHEVTFNNDINTNLSVEFLDGDLKNGDNFPFYDTDTQEIDIQELKKSISGNTGLPDNTIDYIFSKRENEIAMFLSDRLYRFYVSENPTRAELNSIANVLTSNNFDLFPTIKWLLSSDMMYSSKSMNSVVYKNPIELVIGTAIKLNLSNTNISYNNIRNLGWNPYFPGSIFGRDGFDENDSFFTAYNATKWVGESSFLLRNIDVANLLGLSASGSIVTQDDLLDTIEDTILLGREIPGDVRTQLKTFLVTDKDDNTINFDINDTTYQDTYIKSVLHFVLIQPEYVLQSGFDLTQDPEGSLNQFYNNDSKLIIIKAYGGADWLHYMIPKNEYSQYLENRGTGSLTGTGVISLNDDYYINSKLSPLKEIYDNNELKIFNRVGTPDHSRSHDGASRKMTSLNNIYDIEDDGIIGHFIKNEDAAKTVVMGGNKPLTLRGGKYLNIGSDARYIVNDYMATDFKNYRLSTLENIYTNRLYPADSQSTFKNSAKISQVSNNSLNNGGRSGAGSNMEQNFTFVESLFDSNISNVVVMRADGGYDTHRNQINGLNNNIAKVAKATSEYFNRVKDKQDVTILIYSEFGRTVKINASNGTDHGKAGGMFVMTSNPNLKTDLDQGVYGNLSFDNAKSNWLGVGIDYRSVYSQVVESLYSKDISRDLSDRYEIDTYIDDTPPEVSLFRNTFKKGDNDNYTRAHLKFEIDDINFLLTQASYVKLEYGTDINDLYEYSSSYISRYMNANEDSMDLYLRRLASDTLYHYKITLYDNQYNEKIIQGNFTTPSRKFSNENIVDINKDTRFLRHNNKTSTGEVLLDSMDDKIVLSQTGSRILSKTTGLELITSSGTTIDKLTFTGGSIWNGSFVLPELIDIDTFFGEDSIYATKKLNNLAVRKLIKVGSDELGVSMGLNKNVFIKVDNIDTSKNYVILYSEDGITWNKLENQTVTKVGNTLQFSTNHFTLFALTEDNGSGEPAEGRIQTPENEGGNTPTISTGGGSGSPKFIKDICPYGDYSISYYDKSCGIDPDKEIAMTMIDGNTYIEMNNIKAQVENKDITLENQKVQNVGINEVVVVSDEQQAEIELQIKEPYKYEIYQSLFKGLDGEYSESKKEVLKLLRERLSIVNVGDYEIPYIKGSKKNSKVKAIAQFFINKKLAQQHTDELINNLNNLIIYLSIKKLDNIDEKITQKAQELFKLSALDLVNKYNEVKKKKRISFKRVIKKTQKQNNDSPVKNETIAEKIRRINERKKQKELQES